MRLSCKIEDGYTSTFYIWDRKILGLDFKGKEQREEKKENSGHIGFPKKGGKPHFFSSRKIYP